MRGDLDVLSYLLDSMEDASEKLERAVNSNNYSETEKLKKIILAITKKVSEELR